MQQVMQKLSFIGLGKMGHPIAENLLAAGYPVIGHDKCDKVKKLFSGQTGYTLRDTLKESDLVITMLPSGKEVEEVLLRNNNFLITSKDCVFLDMSSSSPLDTVRLGERLKGRGGLLDAPVSGGVKRAKEGSLSIMVGGPQNLYLRQRKLFDTLASKVFYCGELGSGHAMKSLNNYVSAAGLIAACEALIAAENFGISPELVIDILNHSTGKNDASENKLKRFVTSQKFNSGFSLNLQAKDVKNAAVFTQHMGLKLTGLTKMSEILTEATDYFVSEIDHTEIYKFLKRNDF